MRRPSRALFWCNVAAAVMLVIGIVVVLGTVLWTGDLLPPSPLGSGAIVAAVTVPLAFIFFAMPLIEARRETFSEKRTPRVQRASILMAIWTPFGMLPVSLAVTIWLSEQGQLADAMLLERTYVRWWTAALVGAGVYAVIYTRFVVRGVQQAPAARRFALTAPTASRRSPTASAVRSAGWPCATPRFDRDLCGLPRIQIM